MQRCYSCMPRVTRLNFIAMKLASLDRKCYVLTGMSTRRFAGTPNASPVCAGSGCRSTRGTSPGPF